MPRQPRPRRTRGAGRPPSRRSAWCAASAGRSRCATRRSTSAARDPGAARAERRRQDDAAPDPGRAAEPRRRIGAGCRARSAARRGAVPSADRPRRRPATERSTSASRRSRTSSSSGACTACGVARRGARARRCSRRSGWRTSPSSACRRVLPRDAEAAVGRPGAPDATRRAARRRGDARPRSGGRAARAGARRERPPDAAPPSSGRRSGSTRSAASPTASRSSRGRVAVRRLGPALLRARDRRAASSCARPRPARTRDRARAASRALGRSRRLAQAGPTARATSCSRWRDGVAARRRARRARGARHRACSHAARSAPSSRRHSSRSRARSRVSALGSPARPRRPARRARQAAGVREARLPRGVELPGVFVSDIVTSRQALFVLLLGRWSTRPSSRPTGAREVTYLEFAVVGIALGVFIALGLDAGRAGVPQRAADGDARVRAADADGAVDDPARLGRLRPRLHPASDRRSSSARRRSPSGCTSSRRGSCPALLVLVAFIPFVWGIGVASAGLSSPSAAARARRHRRIALLALLSGVYFPIDLLPGWVGALAAAQPDRDRDRGDAGRAARRRGLERFAGGGGAAAADVVRVAGAGVGRVPARPQARAPPRDGGDVLNDGCGGCARAVTRGSAGATWKAQPVAVDVAASRYLGANPSGLLLWRAPVEGTPREALVAQLVSAFGIAPERAGADVDRFIEDARALGLLER